MPLEHTPNFSRVTRMSIELRQRYNAMSLEELQQEIQNFGLDPPESHDDCIAQITSHLEKNGPLLDFADDNTQGETSSSLGYSASQIYRDSGVPSFIQPGNRQLQGSAPDAAFTQLRRLMAQEMLKLQQAQAAQQAQVSQQQEMLKLQQAQAIQQQEMLNKIMAAVNRNSTENQGPAGQPISSLVQNADGFNPLPASTSLQAPQSTENPSVASMNASRFLVSQIPQFGGTEDEDVELWIEKIERTALIHGLPSGAMLSAASIKLTKAARRWFDSTTGPINDSWSVFKSAIIRRFEREIVYTAVTRKADERRWLFSKESFQDYAMDKIAILQCLKLDDKKVIHCLIDDASHNSENFNVEEISSVQRKYDKHKSKDEAAAKPDHQEKASSELFCVYCRSKGHTRDSCHKLKKKDAFPKPAASKPPPLIAAVIESPTQEADTSHGSNTIAFVEAPRNQLITDTAVVKVKELNNYSCDLKALLDTGSPTSFINVNAFKKFFPRTYFTVSTIPSLKAINGSPIKILCIVDATIKLEALPTFTALIRLHVLDESITSSDIIVGRDFIESNNLSITLEPTRIAVKPTNANLDNKLDLLSEVPSVDIIEVTNKIDNLASDIVIDFDVSAKAQLLDVIKEVETSEVPLIEDDHAIKINLKDESVYAFSPRRFAWSERLQIREIIDDLLQRKIIKESDSPYCSRIVPVRKKNGSLRLCVDLRPLNERVVKRKFPFPLIEDCLSRLGDKSVFSLLDLKDGFYQLKVHPDYTKFFSFATPDGQYEYLRLPFGFCEAPAEFQKRLLFILRSFIKEDKILVYLDDIFIPSSSVQENLDVLKQVLLTLKSYASPLNNLLRKDSPFKFDDKCTQSFETLKNQLVSYPILRLYNPYLPTELHTDASALAVAGILMQKQDSDFSVITDCHALVFAINKAHLNPRIARWTLKLQDYRFKIIHREGRRMQHVDALSRVPQEDIRSVDTSDRVLHIDSFPLEKELQFRQLQDENIKTITQSLETGDNDKFELINGLIYRKYSGKPLFVIPESMINKIIHIYHDEMSHCGFEKTVQGILSHYWFHSLRKKVRNYIDNCLTCLLFNTASNTREGELQITDNPPRPFHVLHIDHFGPINPTQDGFKHILVVVDAFSRFTFLQATKSTGTKEVVNYLSLLFHIFSNPGILVSDRGTAFTSHEFASFMKSKGVTHTLTAVASPWANGLVERINRFLKSSLQKIVDDLQIWNTHLNAVQYTINNTFHAVLRNTPSKILLGYDSRNHPDIELMRFLEKLADTHLTLETDRETCREIALQATDSIKRYNKSYYDEKHKKPSKYKIGDFVLIRDSTLKPGEERKFKPSYKGPYLVAKVLNKNRYVITDIPGFNITQKPYNSILSPDKFKPWIKPLE
ncbi:PREDICTED: uncharacterized protein K02A2.6-like [Vollenhovia emeryi]|uniref:uncharacterized protein K02A2.6-like n=1 Tax=Vollenhovia emeryi TaxID=411798 RepID=UPI0005F56836|nr:PREDICTED: uncharacterized protein K02A2.6-like [Vollenhovia emeryi]